MRVEGGSPLLGADGENLSSVKRYSRVGAIPSLISFFNLFLSATCCSGHSGEEGSVEDDCETRIVCTGCMLCSRGRGGKVAGNTFNTLA